MRNVLFILIAAMIFSSCITQKKVTRWLNEHETEAAGYCADKFPPDTTTRVIIDSVDTAAYEAAYWEMARYADSLFNQLEYDRNAFIPSPGQPCPPLMNLDSLRKTVDKEIRKRLIPCKDSLQKAVYTIRDRATERHLQGKIDELRAKIDELIKTISTRDNTITAKGEEIKRLRESKNKFVWMFWGLVVMIGVYVFAKIRLKLPI